MYILLQICNIYIYTLIVYIYIILYSIKIPEEDLRSFVDYLRGF